MTNPSDQQMEEAVREALALLLSGIPPKNGSVFFPNSEAARLLTAVEDAIRILTAIQPRTKSQITNHELQSEPNTQERIKPDLYAKEDKAECEHQCTSGTEVFGNGSTRTEWYCNRCFESDPSGGGR